MNVWVTNLSLSLNLVALKNKSKTRRTWSVVFLERQRVRFVCAYREPKYSVGPAGSLDHNGSGSETISGVAWPASLSARAAKGWREMGMLFERQRIRCANSNYEPKCSQDGTSGISWPRVGSWSGLSIFILLVEFEKTSSTHFFSLTAALKSETFSRRTIKRNLMR